MQIGIFYREICHKHAEVVDCVLVGISMEKKENKSWFVFGK